MGVAGSNSDVADVVRGLMPENRVTFKTVPWLLSDQSSNPFASQPTTLAFFQSFSNFRHHYSRHNEALKYIRDMNEDVLAPFTSCPFYCPENMTVAEVGRYPKKTDDHNMDYFFTNTMVNWSWKEMVAQLDDESMDYVVRGPTGRSGGLLCCFCEVTPNGYDHKRQTLFKNMEPERFHEVRPMMKSSREMPKLPEWDFLLIRQDMTAVRIHPENSKTSFSAREQQVMMPASPVPTKGIGKSDGKGTFLRMTIHKDRKVIKFDAKKKPA